MCAILLSNLLYLNFHLFGESRQLNRAGCFIRGWYYISVGPWYEFGEMIIALAFLVPGSQPSGRDPPVRRLRKARRLRRKRRRKVEGRLNLAPCHLNALLVLTLNQRNIGGLLWFTRPWNTNMKSKHGRLEDDVPLCNGTCCRLHLSFWRCVTWHFYFCPGDRLAAIMNFHGSWPVIVVQFDKSLSRTRQLQWRISLSLSIYMYLLYLDYICICIYIYV